MGSISQIFLIVVVFLCVAYCLPPSPGEDAPASLVILPAPNMPSYKSSLSKEVADSRKTRSPQKNTFLRSLDQMISFDFQKESLKPEASSSNRNVAVAQKKIDVSNPSVTSRISVKRYKHEPSNIAYILNTGAAVPKNYKIDTSPLVLEKSLIKRIHHAPAEETVQGHGGITYQYVYGYPQHQHPVTSYGNLEHSQVAEVAEPAQQKPIQYIYKSAIDHTAGTAITSSVQPHHNNEYASKYQFGYQIRNPKTAAFFGHSEARDIHTTKGNYHVLLPDGRLQKVEYYADKSGFHAQVSYNGAAKHPEPHHSVQQHL